MVTTLAFLRSESRFRRRDVAPSSRVRFARSTTGTVEQHHVRRHGPTRSAEHHATSLLALLSHAVLLWTAHVRQPEKGANQLNDNGPRKRTLFRCRGRKRNAEPSRAPRGVRESRHECARISRHGAVRGQVLHSSRWRCRLQEMTVRIPSLAAWLAIALQVVAASDPQLPERGNQALQISHRARAVAPGEVVLVDVRARVALEEVHGRWLGQTVGFFRSAWLVAGPGGSQSRRDCRTSDAGGSRSNDRRPGARGLISNDDRRTDVSGAPHHRRTQIRRSSGRRAPENRSGTESRRGHLCQPDARAILEPAVHRTGSRRRHEQFRPPHHPQWRSSGSAHRNRLPGSGRHSGRGPQSRARRARCRPLLPGRAIIIDHGLGLSSSLAHLSAFTVAEGAIVDRGQRVGLSGATGRVTGPHLHWTMRVGTARVDPLSLLSRYWSEKRREEPRALHRARTGRSLDSKGRLS